MPCVYVCTRASAFTCAREKRRGRRGADGRTGGGGGGGADVGSHYVEGGDVTDGDGWLRVRRSINPMVPNKLLQL